AVTILPVVICKVHLLPQSNACRLWLRGAVAALGASGPRRQVRSLPNAPPAPDSSNLRCTSGAGFRGRAAATAPGPRGLAPFVHPAATGQAGPANATTLAHPRGSP